MEAISQMGITGHVNQAVQFGEPVIEWPPPCPTHSDIPHLALHTWGAKATHDTTWPASSGDFSVPGLSSAMTSLGLSLIIYKTVLDKITLNPFLFQALELWVILRSCYMKWARGVAAGYIHRHLLLLRSCVYSCSPHRFHSVHCSLSPEATLSQHIFVGALLRLEQYSINLTALGLRTKSPWVWRDQSRGPSVHFVQESLVNTLS